MRKMKEKYKGSRRETEMMELKGRMRRKEEEEGEKFKEIEEGKVEGQVRKER